VKYITGGTAEEISAVAQAPIATLKHVQVEAALRALLKQRAVKREHLSARSVRHVALNEAFRLDLIVANPMLKIKLPTMEPKRAESLTPEQVHVLHDKCRGDWTFSLVELALATDARRGELLALTWTNVDWVNKSINIERSLEQTKAGGLRLKAT
jgi:integrase